MQGASGDERKKELEVLFIEFKCLTSRSENNDNIRSAMSFIS